MRGVEDTRAWLLLAAGDDRGHGGNLGYDDQVDSYYSWDSDVPNHKQIQVGDLVAVWDKQALLGISVIEEIESRKGPKVLKRCPRCGATRINERKRSALRFRCMKCQYQFLDAQLESKIVETYRARYDAAWTDLDGILNGQEVRSLALYPKDFNSMRPIVWPRLEQLLVARGAARAIHRATARIDVSHADRTGTSLEGLSGFTRAFVRVRRGQREFRQHLLESQGSVCAFTGEAPARVLEAGHLYSYAERGRHEDHGGLMLRRDVHRLFDDGALAVDPDRLRADVSPELERYPQYARLHNQRLAVDLRGEQVEWLAQHWANHRIEGGGALVGG